MTTIEEVGLEKISPAEARFELLRKQAGFVLAPIVFLSLWFAPLSGLTKQAADGSLVHNDAAHHLAAIMATTAVLWICESVPLTIAALGAAAACIMLRVGAPEEVFAPFANYIMFLFIGSFILARAVFVHGLNKRFAYSILRCRGSAPGRVAFCSASARSRDYNT